MNEKIIALICCVVAVVVLAIALIICDRIDKKNERYLFGLL